MADEKKKVYVDARFKMRSDTLKNWSEQNPVLLAGEPGVVIGLDEAGDGLVNETEKIKFGDGVTSWNDLPWWKVPQDYVIGAPTKEGGEIFNSYEGEDLNKALGVGSHAEGRGTVAGKNNAHAEGRNTQALGNASHAEGNHTVATGNMGSHAEGASTQALAPCSHAEGEHTIAKAIQSHAEGFYTEANGTASHTEGYRTKANGYYSHAEGGSTQANGDMSHASGLGTVAGYNTQFVVGKYNQNKEDTIFEVGNGTETGRSNAFEVYKDGHAEVQTMGTTDKSIATKEYVDGIVGDLETLLGGI